MDVEESSGLLDDNILLEDINTKNTKWYGIELLYKDDILCPPQTGEDDVDLLDDSDSLGSVSCEKLDKKFYCILVHSFCLFTSFLLSNLIPQLINSILDFYNKRIEHTSIISSVLLFIFHCLHGGIFFGIFYQNELYNPPKNTRKFVVSIVSFFFISYGMCLRLDCKVVESNNYVYEIFRSALLPAIVEEYVFRGWFYFAIKNSSSEIFAGIYVSLLFAFFHFHASLIDILTLFIISFVWLILNNIQESLLVSTITHFSHNFLNIMATQTTYFCDDSKLSLLFLLVGILFLFAVLYF